MTNREEGSTLASYNCDIYMLVFRTTSTTIQNETTKCFSILKYLMWVPTYWSLVTCTISMTDMILKINLMYQVQLPVPWYLRPCYGTCVFHSTRYQVPYFHSCNDIIMQVFILYTPSIRYVMGFAFL